MNIIQIIPGSGGSFYCGNCLRDSKFFHALRSAGNEVVKIPMYLPLFSDEHDLNSIPVFYGAVSTYLKQVYPIFNKAPKWFDNFLNSKGMLKFAAGKAGSTRAKGLEDMTISMLLGEDGKQKDELDKMANWIAENCNPDIVHLSNALLLGLAGPLKQKLNVPVICSLQDEDVWVDAMLPEFQKKIWDLMSLKSENVDMFISVSDYYAGVSKERMKIPSEKIKTIHLGVDPADYPFVNASTKPRNIGYISRMNDENGLSILVDAFIELKKESDFEDVKLIITGGSTGDDKQFIREQKQKLAKKNLQSNVEFIDDFEGDARLGFFKQVSVLSVPVKKGEAFGIYLTEALASGIPIVQPALGAFPEIIEISKAGVVYHPNTPESLAAELKMILSHPEQLTQLSTNGRNSIENHFNIHKLAIKLTNTYEEVTSVVV